MTVPGGVPNLPFNALTLDNIATRLQDMTPPAIRNLANQGLPGIFNGSNGGSVLSDLTPFGVITRLFAEFAAAVAAADPADIQGPEDLPGLMLDFIEGLPIIGELIGLLEAINGQYDGDDEVLLAVQQIFHPIRKLLQLVSGQPVGFPTIEEVTTGWVSLGDAIAERAQEFVDLLAVTGQATVAQLGAFINQIQLIIDAVFQAINGGASTGNTVAAVKAALQAIPGANILIAGADTLPGYLTNIASTGLYDASVGFNNLATSLLKNLTPTGGNIGQFDAAGLAGTINSAAQIGSTAISSIFNGSGQFIGVLNSAATGALNSAITFGGHALSTVLTNITAATGAINAAGITGTLNGAVQLGATALSTLSTNWNAAVTNINNLIGGVTGASTVADVATNINLAATNISQIGTAAQNAAAGIVGSLNAAATQVQTAFSGVFNGLLGGLIGTAATPTNTTQAQASQAMQNVTTNVIGNATALMALQAQQVQQAALMSAKTNFGDYANGSLPSSFTVVADNYVGLGVVGGLTISNGRVNYQPGVTGTASLQIARYNVAPTTTDYQEVSWTSTGDLSISRYMYMRMNSAATSYVRLKVSSANIQTQVVVAGATTTLSTVSYTFKSGAKYALRAGDLTDMYKIYLYENDTLATTVADASHVQQVGASYRYAGFGVQGLNTGTTYDYGYNSFLVSDQLFLPGAPAAAYVSTRQSTASTTYTDLTTVGPAATAIIGSSGMALVSISSQLENSTTGHSYAGFAVSGATTVAAADSMCLQWAAFVNSARHSTGVTFLVTGLSPGSNTFTGKFKAQSTTTATFQDRRISVVPL